jgi:carbon starvation protein
MLFMVVMTLVASWELFWLFGAKAAASPESAFTYRLDAALVAVMAILAVVAVADSAVKWVGLLSANTLPALDAEGE